MPQAISRSNQVKFNLPMPEETHSMLSVLALWADHTRRQMALKMIQDACIKAGARWAALEGRTPHEWWKRELTAYWQRRAELSRSARRRELAADGLKALQGLGPGGLNGEVGEDQGRA